MSAEFLHLLFSLSLSGSLLLVLWLMLQQILQRRLSRYFQYYLLVIVVLRFLLPLTPAVSLAGVLYEKFAATAVYRLIFGSPAASGAGPIFVGDNVIVGDNVVLGRETPPTYEKYVLLAWLVVAFLLLVRKWTKYQSFVKYIKAAWQPVEELTVLETLAEVCEARKITRPIEVCVTPLVTSPLLLGIGKSVIVLPSVDLPPTQLKSIFAHELSHYQRHDLLYKWLVQLLVCLHWFNPAAHYLVKLVNRECEYACDEDAIRGWSQAACYDYGQTLIEMTKQAGKYQEKVASVTLYENSRELQQRLAALVAAQKRSSGNRIGYLILTITLLLAAFYLGAYQINGQSRLISNDKTTVLKPATADLGIVVFFNSKESIKS